MLAEAIERTHTENSLSAIFGGKKDTRAAEAQEKTLVPAQ